MSTGTGYRYLLKTVAAGDGNRDLSQPLTRYYTEIGTPPGHWQGNGLTSLDDTTVTEGAQVTEQQLMLLIGHGLHPTTGAKLGNTFGTYTTTGQHAVAGFDLTFAVPKSVSVLWALSDAGAQAMIAQAHHDAVAMVLDMFERDVAITRTKGLHTDVTGVIAAGFDHYDSRSGDPHLHTHVVVSNKVMPVHGDRWKSLWGTPVYDSAVALSEHHAAVLADLLTARFGVRWELRDQGPRHNPSWEIAGVPETLLREFSSRSCDIDEETDRLVAAYTDRHGRQPSKTVLIKLRQQATLTTRPEKRIHSLAQLTQHSRGQAGRLLDTDAQQWAANVLRTTESPLLLRADDVPEVFITDIARRVLAVVGEKKPTWQPWNLHAEASRQTMGWRFASHHDREAITALIAETAKTLSVKLTPDALAVPASLQRSDSTSRFRPKHADLYTSQELLDAEARLLALSTNTSGPTITLTALDTAQAGQTMLPLGIDQSDALAKIAVSGLKVDVLIGPAGAGKTTTMNTLRQAWETEHGPGSVVGLAPSATAAQVLSEDLGIPTENTAKWLVDHARNGTSFSQGQLVIIDEASLAGTLALDRICGLAAQAGAKVLLVGDWAQLQAVEAGGAFNLTVTSRTDAPELSDVHRFRNDWEKTASLELRFGNPDILTTYADHDRIHDGNTETMRETAYQAWLADTSAGRQSVLIADDTTTVTELNRQARHDRILVGHVDPSQELRLADGTRASVGDTIITRRNDRRLQAGTTGWVRNGDRWTITAINPDGSAIARRAGHTRGGSIVLPAEYLKTWVDLGYAITAHRSQGITVDTSHTVVTETTPRENLYVAMTRGREANTIYVVTEQPEDTAHLGNPETTAIAILKNVLSHSGAEISAHQAKQAEEDRWLNIGQLITECQTLIHQARSDWNALPTPEKAHLLRNGMGQARNRHMIAGLLPEPSFPLTPEIRHALDIRKKAIDERTAVLTDRTLREKPAWLRDLGPYPNDRPSRDRWTQALRAVVTYRDAYKITTDSALGGAAVTAEQRLHRAAAQERLSHISHQNQPEPQFTPGYSPTQRPPALEL